MMYTIEIINQSHQARNIWAYSSAGVTLELGRGMLKRQSCGSLMFFRLIKEASDHDSIESPECEAIVPASASSVPTDVYSALSLQKFSGRFRLPILPLTATKPGLLNLFGKTFNARQVQTMDHVLPVDISTDSAAEPMRHLPVSGWVRMPGV